MLNQLAITYPQTLPDFLQVSREAFEQEAKLAMVVKLFEMKRLSSGIAAQWVGMDRVTFLLSLHRFGVPMIDLEKKNFCQILNMPNTNQIVINTSPLISLIAAQGDLTVLKSLYQQVLVPWEVCQEVQTGGARGFAVAEFEQATFLKKYPTPLEIPPFLRNSLDRGEAAVIQLALTEQISTVCIDEAAGRRVARLHGLSLTGSVGILIRAQREGYPFAMPQAIARMRERGIWLSERVIRIALEQGH